LPAGFGEFQRGKRVGGLFGLRYQDRKIAGTQRRVTVSKFGRDIDFHRKACVTFKPVPGNQPGLKGGAMIFMEGYGRISFPRMRVDQA
jgi:hypothetical protein